MVASFLPREIIYRLGEARAVERIYPDEFVYALYRRLPPGGVFRAPHRITKEITFTSTYWTKKLIGAEKANKKGFTGRDVLVSVIDSGASRVHEQIRRVQFETTMKQYRDENGHGTWCTSCIGGTRARDKYLSQRSGDNVTCEGMAPECDLLAIKSLGYYMGMGSTANILEAIAISARNNAKVISMSLGGESEVSSPEEDPYYEVFEELVNKGFIPVIAAGNSGPKEGTIGTPGTLPNVLTVGAYDPVEGKTAEFSSRGPTDWGSTKPDVMAPGVNIDSAIVGVLDPSGDGAPSRYSPISGTSMATPHVAGLVSLMAQAHKNTIGEELMMDEIKMMMQQLGSSKTNSMGWGEITWETYERWMSTHYGVTL